MMLMLEFNVLDNECIEYLSYSQIEWSQIAVNLTY